MSTDNKTLFQFLMWVNACELAYKASETTPNQPQPQIKAMSAAAGKRR